MSWFVRWGATLNSRKIRCGFVTMVLPSARPGGKRRALRALRSGPRRTVTSCYRVSAHTNMFLPPRSRCTEYFSTIFALILLHPSSSYNFDESVLTKSSRCKKSPKKTKHVLVASCLKYPLIVCWQLFRGSVFGAGALSKGLDSGIFARKAPYARAGG